jgi:hypothetical protein
MSDSDITKTSLAVDASEYLEWASPNHGICLGLLRSNGAILYEILLDEDRYIVWESPEGEEETTYLWSFYSLDKAKAYVAKRERNRTGGYSNFQN